MAMHRTRVGSARRATLLAAALFLFSLPTPVFADSQFALQLRTGRGCLETGDSPVYAVGEQISIFLRVGSTDVPKANVSLIDVNPSNNVTVFDFGQLMTNVTYVFVGRLTPPTGVEQLLLRASGVTTTQRSCSFIVTSATPVMTTPPRPTRTPRPSPSPTPTGGAPVTGRIRTNRGCLEDGQNPTFALGDSIFVSFRVNSAVIARAQVSIADKLPNGNVNIFGFGFVPTNVTFAFSGVIAPPTGTEVLELRARGANNPLDRCSFMVVGAFPTRTPSRTRTPTATSTATPTPTS